VYRKSALHRIQRQDVRVISHIELLNQLYRSKAEDDQCDMALARYEGDAIGFASKPLSHRYTRTV